MSGSGVRIEWGAWSWMVVLRRLWWGRVWRGGWKDWILSRWTGRGSSGPSGRAGGLGLGAPREIDGAVRGHSRERHKEARSGWRNRRIGPCGVGRGPALAGGSDTGAFGSLPRGDRTPTGGVAGLDERSDRRGTRKRGRTGGGRRRTVRGRNRCGGSARAGTRGSA